MRRHRETVLVRRTVQVELVPAGTPVELEEGTWAEVTQALGSSFTLLVEGQLVRLRGSDADAIGKQDPTPVVDHGDVQAGDVEPPGVRRCAPATTPRSRSTSSTWAWSTAASCCPSPRRKASCTW
jgi:hypothetical protein